MTAVDPTVNPTEDPSIPVELPADAQSAPNVPLGSGPAPEQTQPGLGYDAANDDAILNTIGMQRQDAAPVSADTTPPVSGKGAQAVEFARSIIGTPYVYGGTDPHNGIDCSGLVQWAYRQIGIDLPRVTYDQVHAGYEVSRADLQPGDLVFTIGDKGMRHDGHVMIYAGGGKVIVAPHTGASVMIQDLPKEIDNIRRVI